MADRNRELVPDNWSLERERALTTGLFGSADKRDQQEGLQIIATAAGDRLLQHGVARPTRCALDLLSSGDDKGPTLVTDWDIYTVQASDALQ